MLLIWPTLRLKPRGGSLSILGDRPPNHSQESLPLFDPANTIRPFQQSLAQEPDQDRPLEWGHPYPSTHGELGGLRRLPNLKARILKLANCPMVSLPEGMNLKRLSLKRMPLLSELPRDMEDQAWWSNSCLPRGDWNIEACPALKHLPWETPGVTALGMAFSKAGLAGQA